MQGTGLSSINFTTGQVNYSNGTSDALTVTTLTAETEGSKVDKIKVVGEDGKLEELNAGSVIVHEGYQGLVRVNNKGEIVADDDPAADNRWVQQRINSYTFNAAHQSDWEGTDKQDPHRHGGKNVEGAPTETSATGATSKGPVLGKENVKTYTTMDVGDKRIVSDAPRTSADVGNTNTAPTTITLNAGDARIRSLTPPADQATRVVFVPSGVREGWMTADGKQLLHMPDDGLFGAGGTGSALTAVALGAVQTTAFAGQRRCRLYLANQAPAAGCNKHPQRQQQPELWQHHPKQQYRQWECIAFWRIGGQLRHRAPTAPGRATGHGACGPCARAGPHLCSWYQQHGHCWRRRSTMANHGV